MFDVLRYEQIISYFVKQHYIKFHYKDCIYQDAPVCDSGVTGTLSGLSNKRNEGQYKLLFWQFFPF